MSDGRSPNGLPCRYCGKATWSRKPGRDGTTSHPRCRPVHGTAAGYARGCRCDECRQGNADEMRRYRAKVVARDGVSPTQKYRPAKRKPCEDCGRPVRNAWSRCGRCAERHRLGLAKRRAARRRLAEAAAGTSSNPSWPWVAGDCQHCGERFTRKNRPSPFCSGSCRRREMQARWISRSERRVIYERDGWVCQLCSEPVDPDLPYTDVWSATLDHIECRSWSDEPDHSPENLRLAHRWCNSVRGNESFYTEDDLRGVA